MRRILWGLGALSAAGTAAAIALVLWIRIPTVDATPEEALTLFGQVMNGRDDLADRAVSALAGAVEAEPEHAQAQLWLALSLLHRFLERRDLRDAIRASRAFERAVEVAPEDTSAAGWRAFWRYQAARNRGSGLDERREALFAASAQDPRFTPFLVAVSVARLPLESGQPQRALSALSQIEDCGDGTDWTCRRSSLFPYGVEGFHATLGDLHLRLGDLEEARLQYAKALATETSSTWPYREAFESWAASAEDRGRRLRNEDPEDDPPIFFGTGARACAMCHRGP